MAEREHDAASLEQQNRAAQQKGERVIADPLADEADHADQIVEIIE
jgi:hypothetical protein